MSVDDSFTKALLHMDGADTSTTFTDGSGKAWTARGNAQIDTAQSKFGGASGLFDGTGDYIDTPDHSDWQLDDGSNSNEWTIDFWVRFASTSGNQGFISQIVDANNAWKVNGFGAGSVQNLAFFVTSGGTNIVAITRAWSPSINTWYHIAVVKQGTTGYRLFIDGVQQGATETDTSTIPDYAGSANIGKGLVSGEYLNGWIDELRVSKGVARWTSNFTPPTAAYPSGGGANYYRRR